MFLLFFHFLNGFEDVYGESVRNLGAATGAYYGFESPNISVPSVSFVEGVTIRGESVPLNTAYKSMAGAELWGRGLPSRGLS